MDERDRARVQCLCVRATCTLSRGATMYGERLGVDAAKSAEESRSAPCRTAEDRCVARPARGPRTSPIERLPGRQWIGQPPAPVSRRMVRHVRNDADWRQPLAPASRSTRAGTSTHLAFAWVHESFSTMLALAHVGCVESGTSTGSVNAQPTGSPLPHGSEKYRSVPAAASATLASGEVGPVVLQPVVTRQHKRARQNEQTIGMP